MESVTRKLDHSRYLILKNLDEVELLHVTLQY